MYEFLTYLLPVILVGVAHGLRGVLDVDASGLVGPSLVAAGAATLLPLGQPKRLDVVVPGAARAVVVSGFDRQLCAFVWLAVFVYVCLWYWAGVHALKHPHDDLPLWAGCAAYGTSLVAASVKRSA